MTVIESERRAHRDQPEPQVQGVTREPEPRDVADLRRPQAEDELAVSNLNAVLQRVSETLVLQIETLVPQLQTMLGYLKNEVRRIQQERPLLVLQPPPRTISHGRIRFPPSSHSGLPAGAAVIMPLHDLLLSADRSARSKELPSLRLPVDSRGSIRTGRSQIGLVAGPSTAAADVARTNSVPTIVTK